MCQQHVRLVSHRGDMTPRVGAGTPWAKPIICVLSAATKCAAILWLTLRTVRQVTAHARSKTHQSGAERAGIRA